MKDPRSFFPAASEVVTYGLMGLVVVAGFSCKRENTKSSSPPSLRSNTPEWQSAIIVQRDSQSGMCALKANGHLCKQNRRFQFQSLWKYNGKKWVRVRPDLSCTATIDAVPKNIPMSGYQILLNLTDEVGLFWAMYSEDGQIHGIVVYSGGVLPQDLLIGPPKDGFIITGIPSKDGVRVEYVPDPRLHCN